MKCNNNFEAHQDASTSYMSTIYYEFIMKSSNINIIINDFTETPVQQLILGNIRNFFKNIFFSNPTGSNYRIVLQSWALSLHIRWKEYSVFYGIWQWFCFCKCNIIFIKQCNVCCPRCAFHIIIFILIKLEIKKSIKLKSNARI